MVGSAQYRDEEIGWILSAVVSKKTQEFIQENFEEKFGRPLNHNQIRYIKNKYGKDPRFNSPLVNIRSSRNAASPSSSVLDSNDRDDAVSVATTAASERQILQARRRITPPKGGARLKRKRSLEDDDRESSAQHMAKMQRSRPQSSASSEIRRASTAGPGMPLWNAMGSQLSASLHPLSPPPATPGSIYGNSSMYDAGQQLMQGTGSFIWTPSNNSSWNFGESPGLINASRQPPSIFFQNAAASPAELNHYVEQTPALSLLQTPVRTHQHSSQFTLPYSNNAPSWPLSPSMHHIFFSPSLGAEMRYEPRPQLQIQKETDFSSGNDFVDKLPGTNGVRDFSSSIKQEPLLGLMIDSLVAPTVPSFEELPILPANYTHSPGGTANPWMITYTPYEMLPFDPAPNHMPWPFENVKDVGLTAVSSVDIRKDVQQRESRYKEEITTSDTLQDSKSSFVEHVSRGMGSNSVVMGLEMLNMARQYIPRETPEDAAQYAAAVYAKALSSSLALESSPKPTISPSQQPRATEGGATIDPKLLSDRQRTSSLTLSSQNMSTISPHVELP